MPSEWSGKERGRHGVEGWRKRRIIGRDLDGINDREKCRL